jgi:hypothetical protein
MPAKARVSHKSFVLFPFFFDRAVWGKGEQMGLLGWLFGGAKQRQIGRPLISDIAVSIPGDDGTPATKNQIDAIERLICEPPFGDLTYQQAAAIMSARAYSKFVMDDVLSKPGIRHPRRPVYLALQANLIAFIVRDPQAQANACKWSDRNFKSGEEKLPPKNANWQQAIAFITPAIDKL